MRVLRMWKQPKCGGRDDKILREESERVSEDRWDYSGPACKHAEVTVYPLLLELLIRLHHTISQPCTYTSGQHIKSL